MHTRLLTKRVLFLVGLFIVALITQRLVLHGTTLTKLPSAPPLAASVSPSLGNGSSSGLPQPGKDFRIANTQYFDNGQWAVVSVVGVTNQNTTFMVLKKVNGVFSVVVGPGTSFSSDITQSMPHDVADYLISKGLVR